MPSLDHDIKSGSMDRAAINRIVTAAPRLLATFQQAVDSEDEALAHVAAKSQLALLDRLRDIARQIPDAATRSSASLFRSAAWLAKVETAALEAPPLDRRPIC